jgi:hypothetical protein
MAKKRKLNSKNPKYIKSSNSGEKVEVKRVPLTGKAKGSAIFYADEK